MPDSNTSQESTTAQTNAETNASTAQATTDAVSLADFKRLENSVNRLIRLSSEKKPDVTEKQIQNTTDSEDDPKTLKETVAQLKRQLSEDKKRDEDNRKIQAETKKKSAVKDAFLGLKIDPVQAEKEAVYFLHQNGKQVVYDFNLETVVIKGDTEDEVTPLADWFKAEDAKGTFKSIKPGPKTVTKHPVNQGGVNTGNGKRQMTGAQWKAALKAGEQNLDYKHVEIVEEE